MNFMHRNGWSAHFLEADCQTPVGRGRYFDFATLDELRAVLTRANAPPETLADFDHCIRAWGRGSVTLNLTAEQYARLRR